MKLIDAQKELKYLSRVEAAEPNTDSVTRLARKMYRNWLETAKEEKYSEVVRGEGDTIYLHHKTIAAIKCKECGAVMFDEYELPKNFCPNCGRRIHGEPVRKLRFRETTEEWTADPINPYTD